MKKFHFYLLSACLIIFSCKSEPVHPIYGKWKLYYVNDEDVSAEPGEITMEFLEDGTIINSSDDVETKGKFLISDDTTQISVMEGGKVITEFKVLKLDSDELIIEEGYDFVTFRKQEEE